MTEPDLLTIINVLQPTLQEQDEVVQLLNDGVDETMSAQEGFISSSVHRSADNHYVINYAQWESGEHLQAAAELVSNGGAPKIAEAFAKATPDFHPYAVTAQYTAGNDSVYIDNLGELLTIVNILAPADGISQDQLSQELQQAMSEEIVGSSGFVSATIHESMDNDIVVNYAQWQDQESLNAVVQRLQNGEAPQLAEAFGMATPDFHPFTVVQSHFSKHAR